VWPPVLIDERSTAQEIGLIVGGPILAGIIAGLLLGASEPLYLIFTVVMIAAGYATGMEHAGTVEGFYRGLIGGLLFGTLILLTNATADVAPKADLPDPAQWLVVLTTVFGCILGALGGRARARREATAKAR
jgi:sugar phosphate permease